MHQTKERIPSMIDVNELLARPPVEPKAPGPVRRQSPFAPVGHGNASNYTNDGCRCEYCRLAMSDVQRARNGRQKQILTEDLLDSCIDMLGEDPEYLIEVLRVARSKRDGPQQFHGCQHGITEKVGPEILRRALARKSVRS